MINRVLEDFLASGGSQPHLGMKGVMVMDTHILMVFCLA